MAKNLLALLGVLGLLTLGLGLPAWRFGGVPWWRAFAVALALTGSTAAVTSGALVIARKYEAQTVAMVFLGSVALRMFVTLGAALGAYIWLDLERLALGVCLVVCYLAVLAWESWTAVRALRSAWQSAQEPLQAGEA